MLSSRLFHLVAPKFAQLQRVNLNAFKSRDIVVLGLSNVRSLVTRVDQTKTTVNIPVKVVETPKAKTVVEDGNGDKPKKTRKSSKSSTDQTDTVNTKKVKVKAEKPEKIKKEKKVKPPKRSPSAYILFGQDERLKVIAEKPTAKFVEVQGVLAARWKTLPAQEKEEYIRKSDFLKASAAKDVHSKLDSKTKSTGLLVNPYFLFGQDERPKLTAQHPNLKITEITKLIGQQWKALPQVQKETYKALYEKQKEVIAQFKAIDVDQSGYITLNELPHSIPQEGREKMMKLADRDGDGKISMGEYFHIMMPTSFLTKYKNKSI